MTAMMKKAVITGEEKPLKLVTCPIPAVTPSGVKVRVHCAGVCGSDLHIQKGGFFMGEGQWVPIRGILGDDYEGLVMGHEVAGLIEELGEDANTEQLGMKVGDRVMVYPWCGCRKCENCTGGYSNMCEFGMVKENSDIGVGSEMGGGFMTHMVLPSTDLLVKLPDEIPMELGAMMTCSALTAYGALQKARESLVQGNKTRGRAGLLIAGFGGVGRWCLKLAKVMFKDLNVKCGVVLRTESKIDFARKNGADDVVLWSKDLDVEGNVKRTVEGGKWDAAVDNVGTSVTAATLVGALYNAGTLVLVGMGGGTFSMPVVAMGMKMLSIKAAKTGTIQDLQDLADIIVKNKVTFQDVEKYNFEDVNTALDNLRAGKVRGRAVLMLQETNTKM